MANRASGAFKMVGWMNRLRRGVSVMFGRFNRIMKPWVLTVDYLTLHWKREPYVYSDGDFGRNSTLELVAREISDHNVEGAVAELGVYRGNFAKVINKAFPERKLYLFDTFEGFDSNELKGDKEMGFSTEDFAFTDTNVEIVMKKMTFPENIIVKKGFFPETAKDVDERFAFVSIDVDLYDPILAGLKFFYERLNDGGYIFVHDYQCSHYLGVKVAVHEFCKENNIPFVPISDVSGTVVIAKPISEA